MGSLRSFSLVVAVFSGRGILATTQNETVTLRGATRSASADSGEAIVQTWPSERCDVHTFADRGRFASYYLYNRYHDEYISADGSKVDMWHSKGSKDGRWHFHHEHGRDSTAKMFRIQSEQTRAYLGSSDNDNVELWSRWSNDCGMWWSLFMWCGRDERELRWLFFPADEVSGDAPACTFYIMHSETRRWLGMDGGDVHVWSNRADVFEMGPTPENWQWEIILAAL